MIIDKPTPNPPTMGFKEGAVTHVVQDERPLAADVVEPPPYNRGSYRGPASSIAGSSRGNRYIAPLASSLSIPPPLPSRSSSPLPSPYATNHVAIKLRHEPIQGTFMIDPNLSMPDNATPLKTGGRRCFKRRLRIHGPPIADVSHGFFETRQGPVKLNMGIVGEDGPNSKANISIGTRQGSVEVNVLEIRKGRHLSLEVSTRSGDVNLFLPREFSGPLHLHSQRGNIVILPVLARHMRVVNAKEDEALVMLSADGSFPSTTPSSGWAGDFARVTSKSGNLTVGIIGEDKKNAEPGFWKKIVSWFFSGKDEKHPVPS